MSKNSINSAIESNYRADQETRRPESQIGSGGGRTRYTYYTDSRTGEQVCTNTYTDGCGNLVDRCAWHHR